jgi:hypothetical protein
MYLFRHSWDLGSWIGLSFVAYGAFTLDVKSVLHENLDGILVGTQYLMDDNIMLSEN